MPTATPIWAIVLVDDVGAVDLGIDRRDFLEGVADRLGEKAHEAKLDAVLFLKQVLVGIAQVHHRLHVHLVEGGQHGGGVLGVLQPLGDGLAQTGHLDPLFALASLGLGRSFCSRSRRFGRLGRSLAAGLVERFEHVFLEHLAALARTLDARGIDALFVHHLGRGRRRRHFGLCRGRRCFGLGRLGLCCWLSAALGSCGLSSAGFAPPAPARDRGDQGADFDGITLVDAKSLQAFPIPARALRW